MKPKPKQAKTEEKAMSFGGMGFEARTTIGSAQRAAGMRGHGGKNGANRGGGLARRAETRKAR